MSPFYFFSVCIFVSVCMLNVYVCKSTLSVCMSNAVGPNYCSGDHKCSPKFFQHLKVQPCIFQKNLRFLIHFYQLLQLIKVAVTLSLVYVPFLFIHIQPIVEAWYSQGVRYEVLQRLRLASLLYSLKSPKLLKIRNMHTKSEPTMTSIPDISQNILLHTSPNFINLENKIQYVL